MEMNQRRDKAVVPDKRNFYANGKKRLPRQRDIDTLRARRKSVQQTWSTLIEYDLDTEKTVEDPQTSDDAVEEK